LSKVESYKTRRVEQIEENGEVVSENSSENNRAKKPVKKTVKSNVIKATGKK
jgi:hypothetical protein